ncbi:hypothetical protein [Tsuneonella sp. HG222]
MSDGGAPPWDRFAAWPRWAARAALAAIALLLTLSISTALPSGAVTEMAVPSTAPQAAPAQRDTDLSLYDRIAARVAFGEDYHRAAVSEQRAANFPVRPGLAVRLPTMAYLTALTGGAMLAPLLLLGALTAGAWYVRMPGEPGGGSRRVVAVALLLVGASAALNPEYAGLHEVWAGLLIALAVALHRPGRWHWAWLAAAAALSIREPALPLVLLMSALALWRRDWIEAIAWAVLTALFAAFLAWHLSEVNALLEPGDRPSPSWLALRGIEGLTRNIAETSPLQFLPASLAAPLAILPLVGWAGWKSPLGLLAGLLCAGYGLLFMIAGRDNNFYWALLVVPVWFVGYAFVPMALRSLMRAART